MYLKEVAFNIFLFKFANRHRKNIRLASCISFTNHLQMKKFNEIYSTNKTYSENKCRSLNMGGNSTFFYTQHVLGFSICSYDLDISLALFCEINGIKGYKMTSVEKERTSIRIL